MRFADMRVWTRRRLMDEEKVVFPDDALIDSALNVSATLVQARVQAVDPDAFCDEWTRNLEANKYRYQKPRGLIRVKQLFINGVEADPGSERGIETGLYGDDPFYCVRGGKIVISPMPETNVEDGLRVLFVPTLGMAEDDDDLDDLGLVPALHMAVVLWAAKLLMPEGGEDVKEISAEISALLADIPTLYGISGVAPIEVEGLGLGPGYTE